MNTDTIAAIATAMNQSGIGIIRISGNQSIEIVDKIINIFKGLPYWLKPGTEQWGKTQLKLDNGSLWFYL